ncbi:hypothetical protein NPA11_02470 [Mycoplasma sp. 1578d]|uniref:hypothetical protein n=1 Tax=Mycoplasma sp. 1578d TaxID=2967299 RepID=UPI00211CEC59|nr:hypothetical protein [Mycoplasma sp. 1578d]UUM19616.1 hypothetical protein NPA11_02470 [Mycoplasma sp. 1578d]
MKKIILKYWKIPVFLVSLACIIGGGVYFVLNQKVKTNNSENSGSNDAEQQEQEGKKVDSGGFPVEIEQIDQKPKREVNNQIVEEFDKFKKSSLENVFDFDEIINQYKTMKSDLLLDGFYNNQDIWNFIYDNKTITQYLMNTILDYESVLNNFDSDDDKTITKIKIMGILELINYFVKLFQKQNQILINSIHLNYFDLINNYFENFLNQFNQQINSLLKMID